MLDRRARLLAGATLVNTVGTGLYLAAGTLFLIRSAGLRPSQVGLGLTLAGIVGMIGGVVVGDLADRRGPREVVIAAMLAESVATVALLAVHGVASLMLVAGVAAIAGAGSTSGRGAIIGQIAPPGEAARLRTYLRALTNVGVAVGTLGAAAVLAVDTREAYAAMLIFDGLTFLGAAAIVSRLPHLPPTRGRTMDDPSDRRWIALRDVRYLALTFAAAIASLQYFVLTIVLPVWVTLHTRAPRWTAAVLFLLAALIVAALQVPATRSIAGARSAARFVARSGPVFVVAWALFAFAAGPSPVVAVVLLVAAVAIHSLAEVWQAAGAFELSFALARPDATGQYQGVFGLSMGLAEAIAPILLIALCITWGKPGWFVLGGIVTVAGLACAAIERRDHAGERVGDHA